MRWDILIKGAWLLVFAGIVLVAVCVLSKYQGSTWTYLLFTMLSMAVLFIGFGRGAIFFDAFIGVFLWVGFWLKFSVKMAFYEGVFSVSVGAFDGQSESLDQALLVVCCALAGVLLARFFRQRFFFTYPDTMPDISYTGLYAFYRKFRSVLLIIFVLVVLAVCASNAWFGIYQRGQVERVTLPFGLNGVYAWLLMFGMASVSAIILRFELELNKEQYWIAILIALVEVACSNISLWSRGMILNGSALMYGAVALLRRREPRLRLGLTGFVVVAFGVLFVASVMSVNYMRAKAFYVNDSPGTRDVAVVEQTSILFLDRWVGIEGVMAVVGSKNKGWEVFKEAVFERFDKSANAFYDQKFVVSAYDNSRNDGLHFVSLPGYIAFLFYPGSYLFLFCAVFVFSMIAAIFEYVVYCLGGKNLVFCALIAQVIAFRYTSFGYVPLQSYMLFGSILLNVLILFFFDKLLRFSYKA